MAEDRVWSWSFLLCHCFFCWRCRKKTKSWDVAESLHRLLELELFALPLAFLLEVTEEDEEVGRGEEFVESEEEVVL